MKNKIFIITLFFVFGCSSSNLTSNKTPLNKVTCPNILVSSEHQKYISSNSKPITLDNLKFVVDINNYGFSSGCYSNNLFKQAKLSILFIIKPEKVINKNFFIPYYVAILDESDELLEIIYASSEGKIEKDISTDKYIETEIIEDLFIKLPFSNGKEFSKMKIILGFMLHQESYDLLN